MSTTRNIPENNNEPRKSNTLPGTADAAGIKKDAGYAEKQPATKSEATDPRVAPQQQPGTVRRGAESTQMGPDSARDTRQDRTPQDHEGTRQDRSAQLPGAENSGPVEEPDTNEDDGDDVVDPTDARPMK